ncbi:valine--tRNA ligase ValS [Paenibacillus larvae subsp. larvae]|uniref:Valine--tRNA ligase n=1 Tax=Paenibacillus larvae subsp. larvae TaxID=147375 RepID=A0A2L1U3P0_9BACL|nr:valine--tRNA ligase [Paenibacillus larvae]AQZ48958.1 valine--tRNA ligase [Paenibacillus larvae subsp. pulvifaciens]AVF27521.1 valine--tRNA ligase ValS [Paenibacillus larvae subsp. larvae]AVF32184.1 valine--tRNA ligase ValS [Paenibacillus larvae subsp. larvae]MBH0344907.1 valine--tRNA ligase [Paenibacillus larvae]MCY7521447.1 valine--tRNA ligase [Paenibacillus larvae]
MTEANDKQTVSMPTTYDPSQAEKKWYDYWIEKGFFKAGQNPEREPYMIVIPPPNVTGMLHIGHALDFTLQDIIIRAKRMQGYDALWLPGSDHAGIATQTKVEQKLREEGVSRYDLGREAFLEKVWDWKELYAGTIREQWGKMGLSLDFSRERFTLDEGLSKAVRKVFVKLYDKGLIYRGKYIINWDPTARTALSDIEVEYKEIQGNLYHLEYPLKDGSGSITVATTRPETMLGDAAVAVHPEDERYKDMVGKTLVLPIVGREIPVIADEYVDKEFGSGAVKITPAHDPNDFEVGHRHNLPQILVMDESGKMNAEAGPYQGMDRFVCRKKIVADLKEQGVLIRIEEHIHQVGHSERSGAVVEPYLSTQWFVKMKPLAEKAIEVQKSDKGVHFVPDRFEKIYLHWIENIRDWCISRQLWWGHRIPAWYCNSCGEVTVSGEDVTCCQHCQSNDIRQDEDVLDTWFSSALWPFSTLGWPEQTDDLKRYFPTNVLVTGYDIIYFWVARMIFSSLEFTGQIPFKDVLVHGLVRDAEGRKMSKSLGNGIDPLEVIKQYGADAMRYMLSTSSTPGQDLRFRWERVEQARNFANKIWNASRFALMNLEGFNMEDLDFGGELGTSDRWILHRFNETARDVTRLLDQYEFGETGRLLYNFIWDDLCDWYIEFSKLSLYGDDEQAKKKTQSVLVYVLDHTMRLIHPFMPFISEEIWQHLPHEGETITRTAWPHPDDRFEAPDAVREMVLLMDLIRAVRNIRAEVNVPMSKKIELLIKPSDAENLNILHKNEEYVRRFCNTSVLEISEALASPDKAMTAVVTGAELFLPLAGLIDIAQEIARLEKELQTLHGEVARIEKKLANEGFMAKAPEKVIEEEKAKLADYSEKRDKVIARLAELKG